MIARSYPETTGQQLERGWRFGWIDAIVIMTVFVLLWLLVVLTGDMRVRFDELHAPPLSLDVGLIPYCTARTVLRMLIAFAAALLFTFSYGYVAAKSVRARKVMLPLLDILQSVPVWGSRSPSLSAIGLMWNSMMSFGGGWFFVAQSEAISVMNKNIKLPGLGSYMAAAVEAGDTHAIGAIRMAACTCFH
jgi:hypothetical protein